MTDRTVRDPIDLEMVRLLLKAHASTWTPKRIDNVLEAVLEAPTIRIDGFDRYGLLDDIGRGTYALVKISDKTAGEGRVAQ